MADGYIKIDTKILDKDFDKDIARIKAGLIALTGAMSAFGVKSLSVGKSFEKSMSQVGATMGLTVEEIRSGTGAFAELEKAARDAGANTEWSASEAADALNYMALAGYNAEQSIKTLPTVLNLATAGGLELANASDMITDAMSALSLDLKNVGDFSDTLVKASQKSNTSVRQLGEAILTVGGTAKVLKGGVAEMASALGVLANNGIKGAEGGTALRNVINQLSAPTATAQKEMQKLGISVFDSAGNMRSLQDIFKDFNVVLGQMTAQEKQEALSNIFNVRDLKSVQALMKATNGELVSLERELLNAKGTTEQTAQVMQDNLAGSLKSLKSKFEDLSISIYQQSVPALRKAVDELGQFIQGFSKSDAVKRFAEAIGNMVSALTQLVKGILPYAITLFNGLAEVLKFIANNAQGLVISFGLVKAAMIGITVATKGWAVAWKGVGTAMKSVGIGLLIAALAWAIQGVIDNFETLKVVAKQCLTWISNKIDGLINWIAKLGVAFKKILKQISTLGMGDTSEYDKQLDELNKKQIQRTKDYEAEMKKLEALKDEARKKDKQRQNPFDDKIVEQLNQTTDATKKATEGMDSFSNSVVEAGNVINDTFDSSNAFEDLQNKLSEIQKEFLNFKTKIASEKGEFNVFQLSPEEKQSYDEYIQKIEEFKRKISSIQEETVQKTPFGVDLTREQMENLDKLTAQTETFGQVFDKTMINLATSAQTNFENAFSAITSGFEDVGEALVNGESGWKSFKKAGVNAIASVVDALSTQIMAQAVAEYLKSNYAAASTGFAQSASLKVLAGVLKAGAGKFAKGGIVGGSSYSGDKLTANVNSGELILNMAQQQNLANALLSKANAQPMVNIQVINNTNSQVGIQQDEMNNIKILIDSEINSYMTGSKGEKMLSSNYGIRKVGVR